MTGTVQRESIAWETAGLTLVPMALYFMGFFLLFLMCRWLECVNPSVLEWYKRQIKFVVLLMFTHIHWAARHNPSTVLKLNIQVNLSNAGRALQTDLNRIAETANTSTYKDVNSILTETTTTFLKHPDCFIAAYTYAVERHGRDEAQDFLDQLSLQERIRLGALPLVNVKNLIAESSASQKSANEIQDENIEVDANKLDIKAESSTSQKSTNETQDEYMEVIILASIVAKHEFPSISSWDDLKKVLQSLTSSDPEEGIYPYAVEVLWRPKSSSSTGRSGRRGYLRWFG